MRLYSQAVRRQGSMAGKPALLLSLLVCLTAPAARAQMGGTASIYGTITDPSKAAIAGAKVTATNVGTDISWSAVSDASGNYVFPDLPVGNYKVSAAQKGFAAFEAVGVSVVIAENSRVDITMQVGTTKQLVTVSAGAPMVDTQSAATSGTVERQFIDELPLIDRDISRLEILQAGATNITNHGDLSVNGARGGHTDFELDGLSLNNPQFTNVSENFNELTAHYPNPDAIQEFTLVKNGYEAQYGRNEGGEVLVATRSGTNQFHGLGFDYVRNDALDSRSFFSTNKTPYKRNIFGGTFGGPILKDKLFFFGSYEGNRTRANPNSAVENIVPTQAERQGDFSAITTAIKNPVTGTAYAGNIIPTSQFNSITTGALNALVPLPNGPNGELIYAPSEPINSDQEIVKIDAILSSKDHLSGTYFHQGYSSLTQEALPKLYNQLSTPYTTIAINESHSFSPTVVNEFTIGSAIDGFTVGAADVGGSYTWGTFGAKYFIPPVNHSIYGNVSGNVSISDGTPALRPGQINQFRDNVSWIKGNHTLIFGGSGTKQFAWTTPGFFASGAFYFNGYASGNAVSDYLLGYPSTFQQNQTVYVPHSSLDFAAFAQDTWRVTRNLTLNGGIRWVPTGWEVLRNGENANFIAGEQSTVFPTVPRGLVYIGDPGVEGNDMHPPTYDIFEPRIGIAWTPFGHSDWVIRSAFGEFHNEPGTYSVDNNITFPYTLNEALVTPTNLAYPYGNQSDPFPFTPISRTAPLATRQALVAPTGSGLGDFYPANNTVPTTFQWNLTVQHRLGNHDGIEAAYVGAHTYREFESFDVNPAIYIPGTCGATACSTESNVNSRRLYQGFGEVIDNLSVGMSNYNSLQLTYRHEVGKGLTLLTDITWSQTLSISIEDYDASGGYWNPFCYKCYYAPAYFDSHVIYNAAYAWALPWFASGNGLGGHLVKGWTFSGYLNVRQGTPFTVSAGDDNSLSGYGDDHADQIAPGIALSGNRSRGQEVAKWFNTNSFGPNKTGTFGNTDRNYVWGPGGLFWDMSFFRDFPIGERIKLQYRFDGSNIFNHTVLNNPNSSFSSSAFGRIGSTQNPRILQMALRLVF